MYRAKTRGVRILQGSVLAMLLLFQIPGWAADDLVTSQQVEEARMWQSKGRADLAANAWRRILLTNPQHSEALTSLGIIEAKAGHVETALALYQRAKRLPQRTAGLGRLAALMETNPVAPHGEPPLPNTPASRTPRQGGESATAPVPATTTGVAQPPRTASATGVKLPRTSTPRPAPTMAVSTPVPLPIAEVRITPLPFVQISPAITTTPAASEEVRLKPSEFMSHTSAPAPVATATVADNKRRPKPCRLPTTSTITLPTN